MRAVTGRINLRLKGWGIPAWGLPVLLGAALVAAAIFWLAPYFTGNMRIGPLSNRDVHKLGHYLVYGGMTMLLIHALGQRYLLASVLVLAVSLLAEAQQIFIPGRYASWHDVQLNTQIVALAALGTWSLAVVGREGVAWFKSIQPGMRTPAVLHYPTRAS